MSDAATEQPAWLRALAERCHATSQARAAREVGLSPSTINQVLKGTYRGNWERVRTRIEGALLHVAVHCPVLGEISSADCLDYQRRPFVATNPQRVRLYKACRTCPHNISEG